MRDATTRRFTRVASLTFDRHETASPYARARVARSRIAIAHLLP
jgi:hypothetical protein